jgi:hypothetical protein
MYVTGLRIGLIPEPLTWPTAGRPPETGSWQPDVNLLWTLQPHLPRCSNRCNSPNSSSCRSSRSRPLFTHLLRQHWQDQCPQWQEQCPQWPEQFPPLCPRRSRTSRRCQCLLLLTSTATCTTLRCNSRQRSKLLGTVTTTGLVNGPIPRASNAGVRTMTSIRTARPLLVSTRSEAGVRIDARRPLETWAIAVVPPPPLEIMPQGTLTMSPMDSEASPAATSSQGGIVAKGPPPLGETPARSQPARVAPRGQCPTLTPSRARGTRTTGCVDSTSLTSTILTTLQRCVRNVVALATHARIRCTSKRHTMTSCALVTLPTTKQPAARVTSCKSRPTILSRIACIEVPQTSLEPPFRWGPDSK